MNGDEPPQDPDRPPAAMDGDMDGALAAARQHHRAGRLAEAEAGYERILHAHPDHADALHLLGVVAHQTGRHERAVELIGTAIRHRPDNARFLNNLGSAYMALGRTDEAAGCYRRAVEADPGSADGHFNLGNALRGEGTADQAIACYRRALDIEPDAADVHHNLGVTLADQGDWDGAAACYRRAIDIDPGLAQGHTGLGNAYKKQGKPHEAAACYRRALDIDPDAADAHNGLGAVLKDQGRVDAAIAAYRRALEIDPRLAEAHNNLGNALAVEGEVGEAIGHYQRALALRPDYDTAAAALLHQYQQACAWDEVAALEPRAERMTEEAIEGGARPGETPFANVVRCGDPAANLRLARAASDDKATAMARLGLDFPMEDRRTRGPRITLGYLSGDFHNHPTAHLMGGLFALHDRDAFRVIAYSHGKDDGSAYRKRLRGECDSFVDIRDMDPGQAARRIHDDRVDILIDLKGHTEDNRLEICALRPAPVVATYLGFPGTTGAGFIDYILTDRIVTPEDHAAFYSETFAYLPHCYQVNDHTQAIAGDRVTRAGCGLPTAAFVFCSFNKNYKIEPGMFGVWLDLLEGRPDSVLWLMRGNGLAEGNLRREAAARGIAADRLVFAGGLPKERHLARLGLADLALDTRVCNGHTTTSDALWAGVPVITIEGGHFASRVSASILTAVGLPGLVTHGLDTYAALAGELSHDPDKLRRLRGQLAENRLSEPLFDTPRFVGNLENAYKQMWERFVEGGAPRRIVVAED